MSNEEFEKKMEFIVEQQAQFSSDIQQLRQAQAETGEVIAQTGEIVGRLAHVTLEGFKDVNAKIDALVDGQIRADERIAASEILTNEKIAELADAQNRSDERMGGLQIQVAASQIQTDEKFKELAESQLQTHGDLRNLIAVVDRHISEGKAGN